MNLRTVAERNNWRLIGKGDGIHWPELDEDISAEGLWLYEERAWPLFNQALAEFQEDPNADLFAVYLPLFDSARATRARLRNQSQ